MASEHEKVASATYHLHINGTIMTKIDELIDDLLNAAQSGLTAGEVQEKRAALEVAVSAQTETLKPGKSDACRQDRALSHAYCLYSNLLKTDDAAMQAFRSVWADAFTHGFQSGKTAAPPAEQTPHKGLFVDLIAQHPGLSEELKAIDEAPVPTQTPPPRLTAEQRSQIMEQVNFTYCPTKFADAIETAVRKQFGVVE